MVTLVTGAIFAALVVAWLLFCWRIWWECRRYLAETEALDRAIELGEDR